MKYTVVNAGNLVFVCEGGKPKREVSEEDVKGAVYKALEEYPRADDSAIVGTVLLRGEDGTYCQVQLEPVLVPIEHSHAKTLIGHNNNGCEECKGTGIRDPSNPSCIVVVPEGWHVIERCDACEWYDDDFDAARAYYEDNSVMEVYCTDGGSHVAVQPAGRR